MKRLLASRGQLDADDDALASFPGFNFVFVGKAETGMPTFAAPSECQPFSRRGAWWELNKLTLVLAPIIGERFPSDRNSSEKQKLACRPLPLLPNASRFLAEVPGGNSTNSPWSWLRL